MKKTLTTLLLAGMLCLSACANSNTGGSTTPGGNDSGNGGETEQGGGNQPGGDQGGDTDPDQGGGDQPGGGTEGGGTEGGGTEGGGTEGGGGETGPADTDIKKIVSIEQKASLTKHNQIKASNAPDFKDKTSIYKVGDDNAFDFAPVVNAITYGGDDVVVKDAPLTVKISVKAAEGDTYTAAEGEALDALVEDKQTIAVGKINFKDAAIGKTIKLEYRPQNLTDTQKADPDFTKSITFEVVDGYNVYDAKELGYMNNQDGTMPKYLTHEETQYSYKAVWDAFKTANNMPLDIHPHGFILHNDIKIDSTSIPKEYFLEEKFLNNVTMDIKGYLRDRVSLYYHIFENEEKLALYGNYYTIDASKLKPVGLEGNSYNGEDEFIMSHSEIFRFKDKDSHKSDKYNGVQAHAYFENFKALGNSPKAPAVPDTTGMSEEEKAQAEKDYQLILRHLPSGIILHKADGVNFHTYNTSSADMFITYCPERWSNTLDYIIEKSYCTNSFNTFVYNYGCKNCQIIDSTMIGCGGPALLQVHVDQNNTPKDFKDDQFSHTKVINSTLQSDVQGTEGWFKGNSVPTSLIESIKALNEAMGFWGKTFITTHNENPEAPVETFNLIALNNGTAEATGSANSTRGNMTFTTGEASYEYNYMGYNDQAEGPEQIATDDAMSKRFNDLFFCRPADNKKAQEAIPAKVAAILETNGGGKAYISYEKDYNSLLPHTMDGKVLLPPAQVKAGAMAQGASEAQANAMVEQMVQLIMSTGMQNGDKLCIYEPNTGMAIVVGLNAIQQAQ